MSSILFGKFVGRIVWKLKLLYWHIFGKPKKKMLSEKEFEIQGEIETQKAMQSLRNYYLEHPQVLNRFDEKGLQRINMFLEGGTTKLILNQKN